MLADLVVDLFVADVDVDPHAGGAERVGDFVGIAVGVVHDRDHHRLRRRQPQREPAGIVFDQDTDHALEAAENGAVQHDGSLARSVLGDITRVEPLRQDEVDLQRAALPVATDGVAQHEFQFRAVEGAFAGIEDDVEAGRLRGRQERALGLVPDRVAAGAHRRPVGELHEIVGEAQILVDLVQQLAEADRLALDLVLGAEDMGVVLREIAHAQDAVQRARRLEAVARAHLGHAQRQLAIAAEPDVEDLDVARTVHRLQREDALRRIGHEFLQAALVLAEIHVLAELLPVARLFPQLAVDELRRLHLDIAAGLELASQVALERAPERPALGVPEHHARRFFLLMEEAHLAADPAMVALLGLLDAHEVGF